MKTAADIDTIMNMVDILYALDLSNTYFPPDANLYDYSSVMRMT